jgi:hypothetical protein
MIGVALLVFALVAPLAGQPIDLATLSLADAARIDGKAVGFWCALARRPTPGAAGP